MSFKKLKFWNILVTTTPDQALEQAVSADSHSSKAEFVRDAVRRRLEDMGFNPQVFAKEKQTA